MNILNWLNRAYSAYLRRKNLQRAVQLMAVIVVFCTTYALILPAITLESGTICGLTEHSHTEQCYETAAPTECTIPESEGHEHTDECIGTVEKLVCTADHIHEGSCYEYVDGYACGMEETPGHSHAEDSSEPVQVLICGLEEHAHDDSCYPATEPTTQDETVPEETDPAADVETAEDWEASLTAAALTGDWSEDILAIARTQLGYAESKTNYITDEAGLVFGYTRYGQWYGQPYADWSAMFVSFCLHYADIEGIGPDQDCQNWLNTLNEAGIYQEAAAYTPVPGDLIFMDWTDDGIADQVGIVETVTAATGESIGTCQVIAGDCDGQVDRMVLDSGYQGILGYAALPEEPEQPGELSHFYISEDGTYTQVDLPEGSSIPAGAELTVTALTEEHEQYEAMAEQIRSAASGAVTSMTLLDISFYDAKGEYLSVSDTAQVSICFPAGALPTGEVKVFHFVDGVPVELENVSMNAIATAAEGDTQSTQTLLTFETDGFSVFAVTEIFDTYGAVSITDPAELDGNSYYIVNGWNTWIMEDTVADSDWGLVKSTFTNTASLAGHTVWTFIAQPDGTFHIKSDSDLYLVMSDSDSDGQAKVSLTAANDEANATAFTVKALEFNGTHYIEISYDGPNSVAHYLNVFQNNSDFRGWKDSGTQDQGSRSLLYLAEESSGSQQVVTGLDEKELAIVSYMTYDGYHKAMATTSVKVNTSSDGLTTTAVTRTDVEGDDCVVGSAQVWKFDATDTDGVYYISTQVDGATKYLRLLDSHHAATGADGCGSLTLGDEKQAITVLANGDGTVSLSATVTVATADGTDTVTGYVNLDNTAYNYWTYKQNSDYCKLYLCKKLPIDSSFTITYNDLHTITVNLTDINGQPLFVVPENRTFDATSPAITLDAAFAPEIEGYAFYRAVFDNASIASIAPNDANSYIIYRTDYVAGNGKLYTRYENETITLEYVCDETLLTYDLNIPSGENWYTTPSIAQTSQEVTAEGVSLLSVSGANAAGTFVSNSISHSVRDKVRAYYNTYNSQHPDDYRAPGRDYRFLYWKATVDGTDYFFAEGAAAQMDDENNIHITDINGVEQVLPSGTTLTGQWQKISDVVMFFVNYGDTMLEKEDNQDITSTDDAYYTGVVAIGHIYYHNNQIATISPGRNSSNTKDTILKANDASIQAEIVFEHDPNVEGTQIVIDAISQINSAKTGFEFVAVTNYNQSRLEAAVGQYIQNDPDDDKQIKIDGAVVDKRMINSTNYKLYWYLQKAVSGDGWHIDGVLVAKTYPIQVTKTFSGLTFDEAATAIQKMKFNLSLIDAAGKEDDYLTLTAGSAGQDGVYSAATQPFPGSNIYTWTLETIRGQRYAFEETGYEVAEHDCSSLVSVHYVNGDVKYIYNTDTTFRNNAGSTTDGTGLFEEAFGEEYHLVGGNVESVIFANFYTATNTGAFSVSKVQAGNTTNRLEGAEFTLTDDTNTCIATATTNENGAVHFADLPVGKYTLSETKAPAGYSDENLPSWTVEVAENAGVISVTLTDSEGSHELYNSEVGIKEVYMVKNVPESTSLTITKYFSGIDTDDLDALVANSKASGGTNPYYLEMEVGTTTHKLYLADSTPVVGQQAYSWTVANVPSGTYQVTEHNYHHEDYPETVVTVKDIATTIGTDGTVTEEIKYPVITKDEAAGTASFSVTVTDNIDSVEITNRYTNLFQLKLKKVDSETNDALAGAVFKIYSNDLREATTSEVYTYEDENGITQTVYYVGKTTASGNDGIAVFSGLKLSTDSKTYLYVFDEFSTPDGYVKLEKPVISSVKVGGTDGYTNGVLTLEVDNTPKSAAKVSITADVTWDVPWDLSSCPSVQLTLYRSDGTTVEKVTDTVTVSKNADNKWQYTWADQPYAGTADYTYYVVQTPLNGFSTTYSTTPVTLTLDGTQIAAAPAEGTELARSVTVTNTSGYELPSTGGSGIGWMAPLGLALMMAPWLTQLSTRKKKQQGGVNDS